jgi:hypothetical protein
MRDDAGMSRRRWWRVATADEEDFGQRVLYLAHVADLAEWPDFLAADGALPVNALFLATEDAPKQEHVVALAEQLVRRGLFWVSTWGAECERIHDLFDEVDVTVDVELQEQGFDVDTVVISTWHNKDSLEEALEFFWTAAFPDEGKTYGPTFVALAVGSESFRAEVEQAARLL